MACTSCKKKKEIEKLPEIINEDIVVDNNEFTVDVTVSEETNTIKVEDVVTIKAEEAVSLKPAIEEIKIAYANLYAKSLTEEEKASINKVFQYLFKEDFDFNCPSCVSIQARKLKNHMTRILNLKVI